MMKNKSLQVIVSLLIALPAISINAQSWSLTGNGGINANTNFLGTTDNKPVVFRTNNVERMRILKSGEVGLGTANPSAKLTIASGSGTSLTSPGYVVVGNVSGTNLSLDINEVQARADSAASTLYLNYWGGNVSVGNDNASFGPLIYAATDGTVGLKGYNDPNYLLKLNSPGAKGGILIEDVTTGSFPSLSASKSDAGTIILAIKSSTGSAASCLQANNAGTGSAVLGSSTGSDGAGVSAISTNGNGLFADGGAGAGDYSAYFTGSTFCTGSYLGSDQKLKKNIHDFTGAMNIINKLQPKAYEYRHDGSYALMKLPTGERYGLIAQDVEQVLPGLVKESKFKTQWANQQAFTEAETQGKALPKSETIDFKALNYTELIPVLIKAIQEQQQQIDELNQKIEALTSDQNSSLKSSNLNISGALLQQNAPNPFSQNTVVRCNIPSSAKQAQLIIYSADGKALKSYSLNNNGMNEITIHAGTLSSGQYKYALVIDGKQIDSKSMAVTK